MTPPRGPCWDEARVGISPNFSLRFFTEVGSVFVSERITKSTFCVNFAFIAANFGPLRDENSPLIPPVFWAMIVRHFEMLLGIVGKPGFDRCLFLLLFICFVLLAQWVYFVFDVVGIFCVRWIVTCECVCG